MSDILFAMGAIAGVFIITVMLIVAPAMFASADMDAKTADVPNTTFINKSYAAGSDVLVGWLGFDQLIIFILIIVALSIGVAIVMRR